MQRKPHNIITKAPGICDHFNRIMSIYIVVLFIICKKLLQ